MNKFWKWMEEKGYGEGEQMGEEGEGMHECLWASWGQETGEPIEPTKQMLIGYMMEYLMTKHIPYLPPYSCKSIDELYNQCEKEIKGNQWFTKQS